MSVVSTTEETEKRTGGKSTTGPFHTRSFKVRTDSPSDDDAIVMANATIPSIFEEHPNDATTYCTGINADPFGDNRLHWIVTCEYTVKPSQSIGSLDDPWDEPEKITFSFEQFSRPVERAYQAGDTLDDPTEALDNSAEDPFDPPVIQEEGQLLITILRNESTGDFDPTILFEYKNTINDAAIVIAGVGLNPFEARMRNINAVKSWSSEGEEYWEVTYEILVDFRSHFRAVLDQGFYQLIGGVKVPIKDSEGKDSTEPQKLDGSGVLLAVAGDPVYLSFQTYWDTDWTPLNLPVNED